jgi:hypothetical protein
MRGRALRLLTQLPQNVLAARRWFRAAAAGRESLAPEKEAQSRFQAGAQFPTDTAAGLDLARKVQIVVEQGRTDGSDTPWDGNNPAVDVGARLKVEGGTLNDDQNCRAALTQRRISPGSACCLTGLWSPRPAFGPTWQRVRGCLDA